MKAEFHDQFVSRPKNHIHFLGGALAIVLVASIFVYVVTVVGPGDSQAYVRHPIVNTMQTEAQATGIKAVLISVPTILARSIPYSLILLLLILAAIYSLQALRHYRKLSAYHRSISQIVNTKNSIDNYLAVTTHYLSSPVAVMNGAVELLVSLKKIPDTKASNLQTKIKQLGDSAHNLLTANQVSNAQSANDEKLIRHDQPNPYKAKAVWVPSLIALGLIVLANALFMYANVFNRSPYRIGVELGLYALGVFLVALAYRYRNFMLVTKEAAKRQLAMESQLYKKRQAYIPDAVKIVDEHYQAIDQASQSLQEIAEAKLLFHGLSMLGGIVNSLKSVNKFADFEASAPLFDISTYVQKTIHDLNTKTADQHLTFDAKVGPSIFSHIQPEAIKQLVDSLLDNAVKFSKDGGHIEVQAYRHFSQFVFSVSDDGVGISASKLPSLLKPFSRGAESMEHNYDGLGLDLYVDKIIVDRMGGQISINSELGKGTVVTISLPIRHEEIT